MNPKNKKPSKFNQPQTNNVQINIHKMFPEDALNQIETYCPGFTKEYSTEFIRSVKLANDTTEANIKLAKDSNDANIQIAKDSSKRETIGQIFGIIFMLVVLAGFIYSLISKNEVGTWLGFIASSTLLYKALSKR